MQQIAAAPLDHARQHRPHGVNMGHEVDPPLVFPDRQICIQDFPARVNARIVEEYIDGAIGIFDLFD